MRALRTATATLGIVTLALLACKEEKPAPSATPAAAAATWKAGDHVDVEWKGGWWQAEVIAVEGAQYKVRYVGYASSWDESVVASRVRARTSNSKKESGAAKPAAAAPAAPATVAAGGLELGKHGCTFQDGTGPYNRVCTVSTGAAGALNVRAAGTPLNPSKGFDMTATGGPTSYQVNGSLWAFDGCSGSFSGTAAVTNLGGTEWYVVDFKKRCKIRSGPVVENFRSTTAALGWSEFASAVSRGHHRPHTGATLKVGSDAKARRRREPMRRRIC